MVELRAELRAELRVQLRAQLTPEVVYSCPREGPLYVHAGAELAIATPPRQQLAEVCEVDARHAEGLFYKVTERFLRYRR